MASLTVTRPDGTTFNATVSDDVNTMSDDQRSQLFHDILQADATRDRSFSSGFRSGLAAPLEGAANTADVAGVPQVGTALHSAATSIAPKNYDPAAPMIGNELRAGHPLQALEYVPRAVTEGLGTVGGYLGAAGAGEAAGGPVGAVALPLATGVATTYGTNVKARAAAAGRAAPSQADYLGAALPTAAEAALGTFGAGRVPGVKQAVEAAPGLLRPLARAGVEGVGTGGADVAGQVAQGQLIDPYEAAAAGIQGAGGRMAFDAVQGGGRAVQAGGDMLARQGLPGVDSPEEAASMDRVLTEMDQARSAAKDGTPDTQLANNVKQQKSALVRSLSRQLLDDSFLTGDEYRAFVVPAMEQAQRHNNVLTDGPGTAFGELQQLDVPPDRLKPLLNGLRDLNTVSNQSLIKNTRGPFEALGGAVGQIGGIGGAAFTGSSVNVLAAVMGHSLAGKIGGHVGRGADLLFGTNKTPITLQAQRVARIMKQAGIAQGESSNAQMLDALANTRDQREALAAQLGMLGASMSGAKAPNVNTPVADALNLSLMRQAQLADAAGITMNELRQGLQQGLTAAQIARGRDLAEQAGNNVSGRAFRAGTRADVAAMTPDERQDRAAALAPNIPRWPPPKVSEANFVNSGGMAGEPNTGFTTPGYIAGDRAVGIGAAPVKPSGVAAEPVVQQRIAEAFKDARNEMQGVNTQATQSAHASAMASRAAANARARRVVNQGSGATLRPDATAGAETHGATSPDTHDQVAANGGAQSPDPHIAAAKSKARAAAPSGTAGTGWKAYVHKTLKDHGIPSDMSDIHNAVDDLAVNGHLNDLFPDGAGAQVAAQSIKQHKGDLRGQMGREVMRRVYAQVAQNKGQSGSLDQEPAGAPPELAGSTATVRPPVQDPLRWNARRHDVIAHVKAMATAAHANGDTDVAPVIMAAGAEPVASNKASLRDALLASLPPSRHARVSQYFTPTIMRGI